MALLALACTGFTAFGQTSSTGDELEILRSLPADQRDAIIDRVLGRSSNAGSSSQQDTNISPMAGRANALSREPRDERATENGKPILEAEDSLLIEIDFDLPDAPPVVPQLPDVPSASPNGTQSATAPALAPAPTTIVQLSKPVDPTALPVEERERLERTIEQIRSKNPYRLSSDGILYLPGFSGIALAGLTEEKAALRLHSEPALNKLELRVTLLPLKGTGVEALKPFGYELFDQSAALLVPDMSVAVPGTYIVGPDDVLEVQLYGNQDRSFTLRVGRDGVVNFPELGPIAVGGQPFQSVKRDIEARVTRQMIGVQASVSMGSVRGIQIFVLGEARFPGSYTVSGLATITTALYSAGGVTHVGSLRDIQLKRQGAVVGRLDLYDMLLKGDTSHDLKLLPGDAIFIPPVGMTASVNGEVRRPAIYELRGGTTVAELVQLAGGLTPEADIQRVALTRIDENGKRIVLDANIESGGAQPVRNGDALRISRLRPTLYDSVGIEGHVYSTGPVPWRDGLRLSDVIRSVDDLQPNVDVHYVLIRREGVSDRRVSVLSADLAAALQNPGSEADVLLSPRDRVIVFDKEAGRERVIGPLLDELRLQGNLSEPTEVVRIDGHAKSPGEYPLEPGMRVSDLIRAGASLEDAAYGGTAELTRYEVKDGEKRQTELIKIDLAAVLRGDRQADFPLRPFDSLSIKGMPEWGQPETIELVGEVRFPGSYEIRRGETLKSVLQRAGGLTSYAFAEGSVFTREELKEREQEQLERLAQRLQNDLATLALQGAAANQSQAASALSIGQSLLAQLRSAQAVGRLVIDVRQTMSARDGSPDDIVLHDGDKLIVPKMRQEVMVLGEVQNATSHLYHRGLGRDSYISMSGGITRKADKSRIYVVRADGSVVTSEGGRWFRGSGGTKMQPGDSIVVPLDTERMPALPFWQAVTQILYNVAVSVAAVSSF